MHQIKLVYVVDIQYILHLKTLTQTQKKNQLIHIKAISTQKFYNFNKQNTFLNSRSFSFLFSFF